MGVVGGNLIVPDGWVTSRWDSRWEDWVKVGRNPDSCRPSFWRGPTVLGRTNPENDMDRPASPDSVEPKVELVGLIRQKGKIKTGIS